MPYNFNEQLWTLIMAALNNYFYDCAISIVNIFCVQNSTSAQIGGVIAWALLMGKYKNYWL